MTILPFHCLFPFELCRFYLFIYLFIKSLPICLFIFVGPRPQPQYHSLFSAKASQLVNPLKKSLHSISQSSPSLENNGSTCLTRWISFFFLCFSLNPIHTKFSSNTLSVEKPPKVTSSYLLFLSLQLVLHIFYALINQTLVDFAFPQFSNYFYCLSFWAGWCFHVISRALPVSLMFLTWVLEHLRWVFEFLCKIL